MRVLPIFLIIIPSFLFAQQSREVADSLFNNQKWSEAIKSYKKYLKKNEQDSMAWYRVAKSYAGIKNYEKALESFDQALATNFFPSYVHFNKAKTYAAMKKTTEMYLELNDATSNGFFNYKLLTTDEDFGNVLEETDFQKVISKAKENAYPCLTDSNARHFDFWIGTWDVYAGGRKVGENTITMANGGCAIHESYTTPGVYTGQSVNYYDKLDKKWHQTWVDSGGGVLDYVEIDKAEGMLQFQCDYMNRQGQVVKSRLTFTKNDDCTVRQLFEDSTDGGENWTPGFDGLYKPQEKGD
ncbi:MAG: tetratricopeptide repeat protein [Cyclobacteriaceae bacterium]